MYEEYIKQWRVYANKYGEQTCLFLMVGKFYELYDILDKETNEGQTNVKQAVDILGIQLSIKKGDGPKGADCLFAGFPEQSLQKFAGLLTREGWTVVVCDQEKEGNKVTGRPVARIFSPGTHVELAGQDAPYLAGLWLQEGNLQTNEAPSFAAVILDMTTGQLVSYEGKGQGHYDIWSADDLVHFFQVHNPREVVIWWRGDLIGRPGEAILRRRFGLVKGAIHLEHADDLHQGTFEHPFVRKSYLENLFSKRLCLLPIHEQLQITNKEKTERALVCLLRFAEEHLPSAIQNLYEHTAWSPEQSVYMGNNTLLQLNYISHQSQEQSVLSLFQKTMTSLGKRALRERLLNPSSQVDTIRTRLDEVNFFYTLPIDKIKYIESYLRLIHDIARLHRKVVMYSVTAADILALEQSYRAIKALIACLQDTLFVKGNQFLEEMNAYLSHFSSCFDIEKAKEAISNEDVSFLPSGKAPLTAQVEEKLAGIQRTVKDQMEQLRIWVGLPEEALRIESLDTLSFFFTATKTTLNLVKKKCDDIPVAQHPFSGIVIHNKKTGRGSIEYPALEQFHYQTIGLRGQLQKAIKEELPPLCQAATQPIWHKLEQFVSHIDVSLTLAKVAKERGYVMPIILDHEKTGEAGLDAKGLRHPLLESIQTRTEYVRHDVSLGLQEGDDQGWLLYGMNASGKSSLMKALGIATLLAQAGCFVPATVFKLKPFQSILTRILNQDNLWAGLSSFAVEISELRDIFKRADERSLVLGDELCSGTESVSATSLVAAGIQYLHTKQTRFVFATHLHDLMKLPAITELAKLGVWHLRVHYDAVKDTLVYDRTLHKGQGGTRYGLEVARAMHLPHDILEIARTYRKQLLGETDMEDAGQSSWNSNILRKECELCKSAIVRDLEVHHIRPRAEANKDKRFEDNSSMNDLRNLIVVCQSCHDKHHAGKIIIGEQKQTSEGPQRIVEVVAPAQMEPRKAKQKWTEEEIQTIESYLRKYSALPLSRLMLDLKEKEGIDISKGTLQKMRSLLT